MADLDWIHALPGRKIFIKGNHDLWWTSANKLNKLYADGTMQFLQCNAQILDVTALKPAILLSGYFLFTTPVLFPSVMILTQLISKVIPEGLILLSSILLASVIAGICP